MSARGLFNTPDKRFFWVVAILNLLAILFVYQSVFKLEIEGDTWQYAWGHQIYYHSNVFSKESLAGMHTSLGGASLTFGLIQNHLGLSGLVHYLISMIFKFLSVLTFYFLLKKLTQHNLAALIGTLLLSVTFAGVEATHWVFNMYAYIGLIFIMLCLIIGYELPNHFTLKRWLSSYFFACLGVWYATMRTNGIIPIILVWSAVKFITLRSKSSRQNLVAWIVGIIVFLLIDKFLLGQMETDYSQKYIIGQGIQAFKVLTANSKYDFLISPASNLGVIILPDISWYNLNFPKIFSFFGGSIFKSVTLPSFIIFVIISWSLTTLINSSKNKAALIKPKFVILFSLGLYWTGLVYFISKLGPLNFSAWESVVYVLFGGYFIIIALFLTFAHGVQANLKDLFGLSFLWSFVFLLLPLFMNGGPVFGTYHRYLVTTAPAVPMLIAGLISLSSNYKNRLFIVLTSLIVLAIFFSHASQTKAFFDRKALAHNRPLAAKIWQQFTGIVPNKPEYVRKNPPTIWFEAADNPLDRETIFETLYFGFLFKTSIKYGWDPQYGADLYYENYKDLLEFVKKNPSKVDDLYGVRMENQSLVDVTQKTKNKINQDLARKKSDETPTR